MTHKVHGFTATPDQFLSGGLPMFEVSTTADLTTKAVSNDPGNNDVASDAHNVKLDKLIEAISVRAQPVIMGTPADGKFRFAVEHADIFGAPEGSADKVAAWNDTVAMIRKATGDNAATLAKFNF